MVPTSPELITCLQDGVITCAPFKLTLLQVWICVARGAVRSHTRNVFWGLSTQDLGCRAQEFEPCRRWWRAREVLSKWLFLRLKEVTAVAA